MDGHWMAHYEINSADSRAKGRAKNGLIFFKFQYKYFFQIQTEKVIIFPQKKRYTIGSFPKSQIKVIFIKFRNY